MTTQTPPIAACATERMWCDEGIYIQKRTDWWTLFKQQSGYAFCKYSEDLAFDAMSTL